MNIHPPKWSVYAGIGFFTFLLAVFIAWQFAAQNSAYNKAVAKQKQQQAKEYKAVADSIEHAVKDEMQVIIADKNCDSIRFVIEKESLRANYLTKVKKYEAKLLAIDTMPVPSVSGNFSVRSMLSDSACKVW